MKVPVKLLGLHFAPSSGATVVLLGEFDNPDRVLPIFIGPAEARSIAMAMAEVEISRPQTHDLFVDVIEALGAKLVSVDVNDLIDSTFFADLSLEHDGETVVVSSRPSDGIALAVRVGAPVNVESAVLDEAAVVVDHDVDTPFADDEIDQIVERFQSYLETVTPDDFVDPND